MFTITAIQDGSFCLASSQHQLSAVVDPLCGMNICGLTYQGQSLIHCDQQRKTNGATYGCPILYPAPNRVKGSCFCFENLQYTMPNHGVARQRAFAVTSQSTTGTSASLTGRLAFSPGSSAYKAFPIHAYLELTVTLSPSGLRVEYTVCNLDSISLPYGIAVHPFFNVLQGATLCCNAPWVMEMTPEKLPTGRLLPVGGTAFDLRTPRLVEELALDHVYYSDSTPITACLQWHNNRIGAQLSTSPEFSHIVVYTPAKSGYFCVENQSCSTNCHNLYAAGFVRESGLKILPPGTHHSGWVQLAFFSS